MSPYYFTNFINFTNNISMAFFLQMPSREIEHFCSSLEWLFKKNIIFWIIRFLGNCDVFFDFLKKKKINFIFFDSWFCYSLLMKKLHTRELENLKFLTLIGVPSADQRFVVSRLAVARLEKSSMFFYNTRNVDIWNFRDIPFDFLNIVGGEMLILDMDSPRDVAYERLFYMVGDLVAGQYILRDLTGLSKYALNNIIVYSPYIKMYNDEIVLIGLAVLLNAKRQIK